MNKYSRLLVIVGTFLIATVGQVYAGYLHWMIDQGSIASGTSYAMLKVDGPGGSQYLTNANLGGSGTMYYPDTELGWEFAPQFSEVSKSMLTDSYRFIIELYGVGGEQLSIFNAYLGGQITDEYYGPGSGADATDIYVFENQNIPEPTSGMLMLFGLGLLALRRKQKKA